MKTAKFPHLSPKAVELLARSDEERVAYIRQPRWIGYPRANEILEKLEELLIFPQSHRMPNCLVYGETNNGKTMLVQRFFDRHKPDDNEDGESAIVPVLYVQAPPVPDEGRLYNSILEKLFAPYKPSDRADRKEFQTIKLMREVGVRMLIIDELHHLIAGSSTKQKAFLNVIKHLGNELQIPMVGVGTKEAIFALATDQQLMNRFDREELSLWQNDEEYLQLLSAFERTFPLRKPSFLIEMDLADQIYAMGEGYLGETSRLLIAAGVEAIKTGKEQIDKRLLKSLRWSPPSDRRREVR